MMLARFLKRAAVAALTVAVVLPLSMNALCPILMSEAWAVDRLIGRAILPAASFAPGSASGALLGDQLINGREVPFVHTQPVQGFPAILAKLSSVFSRERILISNP